MISTVAAYVPRIPAPNEIRSPRSTRRAGAPPDEWAPATAAGSRSSSKSKGRPLPAGYAGNLDIMTSAALRRRNAGPMNRPSPALYLQDVIFRDGMRTTPPDQPISSARSWPLWTPLGSMPAGLRTAMVLGGEPDLWSGSNTD